MKPKKNPPIVNLLQHIIQTTHKKQTTKSLSELPPWQALHVNDTHIADITHDKAHHVFYVRDAYTRDIHKVYRTDNSYTYLYTEWFKNRSTQPTIHAEHHVYLDAFLGRTPMEESEYRHYHIRNYPPQTWLCYKEQPLAPIHIKNGKCMVTMVHEDEQIVPVPTNIPREDYDTLVAHITTPQWYTLSDTTQNVLEHCWIHTNSDRPTEITVPINEAVQLGNTIRNLVTVTYVTPAHIQEMLTYQQQNPHFTIYVHTEYDYDPLTNTHQNVPTAVTVRGICDDGEWDTWNHTPRHENIDPLAIGQTVYIQDSCRMDYLTPVTIARITPQRIICSNGFVISRRTVNQAPIHHYYWVEPTNEFTQRFIYMDTHTCHERYTRQALVEEFNDCIAVEDLSNEEIVRYLNLAKLIELENENAHEDN